MNKNVTNTIKEFTDSLNTTNSKKVRIRILNQNGDDSLEQELGTAIATVLKEHFSHGKFAYTGAKYFQFSAKADTDAVALFQDAQRLRALLEENDEVVVTLTGGLVGGC